MTQQGGEILEGSADSEAQDLCLVPAPAAALKPAPTQQAEGAAQQGQGQGQEQQATSEAAKLYVKESKVAGVEVHPDVLKQLNAIPDKLVQSCSCRYFPSPDKGGASLVLSGIPGLSAKQVMVVLRVVLGGDRSSPEGRGPFSVVPLRHLDLSGVQVGAEVVKYLALGGGLGRLFKWCPLLSLDMAGCRLGAGPFRTLHTATELLANLRWLELRDNDFQGNTIEPVTEIQQMFHLAPLVYLGIENTGLCNDALAWLLEMLLRESKGTLLHLQALRLGPPAGGGLLSDEVVGGLMMLVGAAPKLQALVVHGLSEEAKAVLTGMWAVVNGAEALPFWGDQGEGAGWRISTKPLCELLAVEVSPTQLTEPAVQPLVNPRFPAGSQHERGFLDVSMVDIVAKVKTWTANRPIANLQERIVRRLETWAQAEQAELQQQQEAGLVQCDGCEGSEQSPNKLVAGSGLAGTQPAPTTCQTPGPYTPYPHQGEAPASVKSGSGSSLGTDGQQTISPVRAPPAKRTRAGQHGRGGDQDQGAMPSQPAACMVQPAAAEQGEVAGPSSGSKALQFGAAAAGSHQAIAQAEAGSGSIAAAATQPCVWFGRVIPDSEDEESWS